MPPACLVDDALARHTDKTGQLLNVLNDVQDAYRYLPAEAIERISERMGVPAEQIMRMGEFFNNLSLDPVGRCIIDVCDGTACHTQGAPQLVAEFEKKLGISAGQTTADGSITLRTVGCVGACGIAPVVVVEGDAYGRVRVTQVGDVATIAYKRAERDAEEAEGEKRDAENVGSAIEEASSVAPATEVSAVAGANTTATPATASEGGAR